MVELSVGYITHLCKVGEILESILLVQHNMDQMERFLEFLSSKTESFDYIRDLIL